MDFVSGNRSIPGVFSQTVWEYLATEELPKSVAKYENPYKFASVCSDSVATVKLVKCWWKRGRAVRNKCELIWKCPSTDSLASHQAVVSCKKVTQNMKIPTTLLQCAVIQWGSVTNQWWNVDEREEEQCEINLSPFYLLSGKCWGVSPTSGKQQQDTCADRDSHSGVQPLHRSTSDLVLTWSSTILL